MLLSVFPSSSSQADASPTFLPAFPLPFSSCYILFFLASQFTFLLCRERCVVLTFPPWHLKCFLVQNILFIAIETGSSVWKKKKKKHTEVWESEALQFCYFAQIHKWQHAGRYAKACSLPEQEEGPPILGKLFTGFKSWFKPGESVSLCEKNLCFSLMWKRPAGSREVRQTLHFLAAHRPLP